MVKTVLLEIHHLYYWPNFQPVIEELVSRKNYIIHVSTPFRNSRKQENIFRSLCSNFSIQFISSDNEDNRRKKIIGNSYDVIIIGNLGQINKISIMQLSKDGQKVLGSKISITCDCLGVSGGWTPAVHLFTQSGGKLRFRDEEQVFIPNIYSSDQISIGSCNGDFTLDEM